MNDALIKRAQSLEEEHAQSYVLCVISNYNKGMDTAFEEDLAKDVLEIITVFSARLYGSRSRKNQKLPENGPAQIARFVMIVISTLQ